MKCFLKHLRCILSNNLEYIIRYISSLRLHFSHYFLPIPTSILRSVLWYAPPNHVSMYTPCLDVQQFPRSLPFTSFPPPAFPAFLRAFIPPSVLASLPPSFISEYRSFAKHPSTLRLVSKRENSKSKIHFSPVSSM